MFHFVALLVIFLAIALTVTVLRWAYLNGFWDISPQPRVQPSWKRRPSVRSNVRIPNSRIAFLDIETDPSGNIWCIGICEEKGHVTQFVSRALTEERQVLVDFVNYARSNMGTVFCYYAGIRKFDENVLRRRLAAYGLPSQFFVMKDLFHTIRASLKIQKYGLKYVGARLGYQFRHWELNGGVVSVLWRRYLRIHDGLLLRKLMEYNEDDVKVLSFILEWFRQNHSNQVQSEHVRMRHAKKIAEDLYEVPSFTGDEIYEVNLAKDYCTCPVSRGCKHLKFVREFTSFKEPEGETLLNGNVARVYRENSMPSGG